MKIEVEGNGLVLKKLKRGTGSSENDRNSTTPDKEIRLCNMVLFIYVLNSTPPHLKGKQFFPFLCTTIPAGFHDSLARFLELQVMFFSSFNPKETVAFVSHLCQLQNDMKRGTSPSSNGWDFIPNTNG